MTLQPDKSLDSHSVRLTKHLTLTAAVLFCVLAIVPERAVAFSRDNHEAITVEGLKYVGASVGTGDYIGFSNFDVIDEIAKANSRVDLYTVGGVFGCHCIHFDDDSLEGGAQRVSELRDDINSEMSQVQDLIDAGTSTDDATLQSLVKDSRATLGEALHTIQDFYAHTTWVDLGNGGSGISWGDPNPGFSTTPPTTRACKGITGTVVIGGTLSSEHFLFEDVAAALGSCVHGPSASLWCGGSLSVTDHTFCSALLDDISGRNGINKDTAARGPLHYTARAQATGATTMFAASLLADMAGYAPDALCAFVGLRSPCNSKAKTFIRPQPLLVVLNSTTEASLVTLNVKGEQIVFSNPVTWAQATDPSVASVQDLGNGTANIKGLSTGGADSQDTEITATDTATGATYTTTVTVFKPTLTISPENPKVPPYSAMHLDLETTDPNGDPLPPPARLDWHSTNTTAVAVNGGTVTTGAGCSAIITVTDLDSTATASTTVTVDTPSVNLALDPNPNFLAVGDTADFLVSATDCAGAEIPTPPNLSWQSLNQAVATVGTDGSINAIGVGSATITVRDPVSQAFASATVTVSNTLATDGLTLTVDYGDLQFGTIAGVYQFAPQTGATFRLAIGAAPVNGMLPTGIVTFSAGGHVLCRYGVNTVGTTDCTAIFNSPGSGTVVATYTGDANFKGGKSNAVRINVVDNSITGTCNKVADRSVNPTWVGPVYRVTLTATVVAPQGHEARFGFGAPFACPSCDSPVNVASASTWTVAPPPYPNGSYQVPGKFLENYVIATEGNVPVTTVTYQQTYSLSSATDLPTFAFVLVTTPPVGNFLNLYYQKQIPLQCH